MPDDPTSAGGPAPTSGQPQAGTPQTAPQAGDGGQQPKPSLQFKSLEEAESAFERILRDKQQANQEAKTAKDELKKLQDAQKTAEQRAAERLAELEAQQTTWQREMQELRVAQSVERQASKFGIVDTEAAVKLMDWSQLEFDKETGQPTNVEKVLKALVKDKPYLVGQTPVGNPVISPTNPGQQPGLPFFTKAQLQDIEFYEKNKAAIKQAFLDGRYEK
jgi:hypothetical protein